MPGRKSGLACEGSELGSLMPDRMVQAWRVAPIAALVLSACSTSDNMFTVFADPGKYQYYSCDQIAGQRKTWALKEQELRQLMNKADQSAGGSVVNALAYKSDYVAASEELKVLEATARSKNCDMPENWRSNSSVR
jgi:hypothetical protein